MGIAPRGSTFSTSPQRDGKSQPYTDYTGRFPLPPVDWNPIGRESLGPPDVQRNTNFRGLFCFFLRASAWFHVAITRLLLVWKSWPVCR
jgi:hypothetical protein